MYSSMFLALQINKNWEEQKTKKQKEKNVTDPEETIRSLKCMKMFLLKYAFAQNKVIYSSLKKFISTADDPNLKAGIMSLANLLKIPEHEDPLLRLHVGSSQSFLANF